MSAISRAELFTDIILSIDETPFKDKRTLKNIVESRKDCYSCEKKGSCYRVKGTFEQLDKLVSRCQRAIDHRSAATHGRTGQHSHHASTRVKSVEVSRVVMDYINKKCEEKLGKILGNCSLVLVSQSDITARITFRPQSDSFRQAAVVRQRFITFYQRVASDLHIISVPGDLHEHNKLQRKFPTLIFEPSNSKLTVMGPFPHIAEFKEFLWKNRSTKRLVSKTPTDSLSSRISASSSAHKDPDEESCPICMETIVLNKKKTLRCKHSFCSDCLEKAFVYKPVCPTCGELYGTLKGTQPDGGTMEVTKNASPLPGYEKYGTIVIHYYIPRGIQKEEHPSPGQPYEGASRTAYLPDSPEGRMVLGLLRRAFDQRLVFTIGRSTTSGRNNTVTWNDIHHKTSTHGGPTHYGYPDPEYLSRVRDELKVKGIE